MRAYSLNGNIKMVARTSNGSTSDNFTFNYTGNQLTGLSGVSGTYTYDANGNMANDPRKGLQFAYNSLNLLQQVEAGSTIRANYLYAADGTKLQVRDAAGTSGYDYLGSLTLVKTNGITTPEVAFSEGVIRSGEITYFERDHIGSVRATITGSASPIYNDYYPFGKRHPGGQMDANNRYLFNGKENQVTGALNLLDYGARMYDHDIARWLGIDPLAEKYYSITPYSYVGSNSVRYIDIKGDSINVAWFQQMDAVLGTTHTQTLLSDLSAQTGLTYSIDANGVLTYATDANGDAVIATDANGNQSGSATARDHMMSAIGHADMVTVKGGVKTSTIHGTNTIGFNHEQMSGLIGGAVGVDNRTMGYGMTFMHELYHTNVGGGLSDSPYSAGNPGPVVTNMNVIRSELNAQGGNYGQRMEYKGVRFAPGKPAYVPFSPGAAQIIQNGYSPSRRQPHIMIP